MGDSLFQLHLYVFIGQGGNMPSGVFNDEAMATHWIKLNHLTGRLVLYPLNQGVYDWYVQQKKASQRGYFVANNEQIGRFCSHLDHRHFEKGEQVS
jgi:hypothetical protein